MLNNLTQEIVDAWVNALRSGKYKQGKEYLYQTKEGYCCLGVLCDLYIGKGMEQLYVNAQGIRHTYKDTAGYSFLPEKFAEELGLSVDPSFDNQEMPSLSSMNDNNASFNEIADAIEKYWRDLR